MHAAVQPEAAPMVLIQRAQKYQDAAALKLIESVSSTPPLQLAAPAPRTPPVQPLSAAPREGSSLHVIA